MNGEGHVFLPESKGGFGNGYLGSRGPERFKKKIIEGFENVGGDKQTIKYGSFPTINSTIEDFEANPLFICFGQSMLSRHSPRAHLNLPSQVTEQCPPPKQCADSRGTTSHPKKNCHLSCQWLLVT